MENGFFRKGLILGIIILFVGAGVFPSTVGIKKEKTTIMDFKSGGYIQDLIDNASDGDTINIPSGIYYENIVIDKSINLIGEDKDNTIINGSGNEMVIDVTSDWVNISGFTLENSVICGIKTSSYNTITDTNIINNWKGIEIRDTGYITVNGNTISNNQVGIDIYLSSDNTIESNIISNNKEIGIGLDQFADLNTIDNNYISDCDNGLFFTGGEDGARENTIVNNFLYNTGIRIAPCCYYSNNFFSNNMVNDKAFIFLLNESNTSIDVDAGQIYLINCDNITIQNQEISTTNVGIELGDTNNCSISNNIISLNFGGSMHSGSINLYHSNNNIIIGNSISNDYNGIYVFSSDNNHIYHNDFIDNTNNAYDECNNIWDNGYPSGGNFWDDYNGTDSDGDGIGDTPHPIPGGDNEDRYPLGNFKPSAPTIDGPTSGNKGVSYDFTFNAVDLEGDDLYYFIDWGDGGGEEWNGPHPSGTDFVISHSFPFRKTFTIEAKVKDIHDSESGWTYFDIEIPRNRAINNLFLLRFLERFLILENLLNIIDNI